MTITIADSSVIRLNDGGSVKEKYPYISQSSLNVHEKLYLQSDSKGHCLFTILVYKKYFAKFSNVSLPTCDVWLTRHGEASRTMTFTLLVEISHRV